jgi:hypothetical protein
MFATEIDLSFPYHIMFQRLRGIRPIGASVRNVLPCFMMAFHQREYVQQEGHTKQRQRTSITFFHTAHSHRVEEPLNNSLSQIQFLD